jgi:hypothetical protein
MLGCGENLHRQFLPGLQKVQHSVVGVLLGYGEKTKLWSVDFLHRHSSTLVKVCL